MSSIPVPLPVPGELRQRDGYSISVRSSGLPMLSVARWSDEFEAMLAALPAVSVSIAGSVQGTFHALPRLLPYADRIVAFSAPDGLRGDLSPVNALGRLEELSLHAKARGVDLSSFPRLRRCLLDGAWDLAGLAAARELEELHLEGARAPTLAALAPLRSLRGLSLWTMSRLESLDGIEGLPIETLKIYQARALRSARAVASLPALRVLELDGVRSLGDVAEVGHAATLEELAIIAAAPLPAFDFVAGLARLRQFHLAATDVAATPASLAPFRGLRKLHTLRLLSGLEHATDVEVIGELHELRLLVLNGLRTIPSLAFVRTLERLDYLGVDAAIEDGDLSPVAELPHLTAFRLGRHRAHYSHTAAQLAAIIDERHPEVRAGREHLRRLLDEGSDEARRNGWTGPAARSSRPAAAPPAAAEGGFPAALMRDVPWRFDERAATREALVAVVERASREATPEVPWDANAIVLAAPRLRVAVPGFGEPDGADDDADGDADGDAAVVALESGDPAGFTAGDLLFRLHVAVGPLVSDTDYRYFEGLVLTGVAGDGVPVYELRLGS